MPPASVTIRMVIADDHEVIRHGLASVFQASGIDVVGEAADGDEALRFCRRLKPDVLLLDVRMDPSRGPADGLDAIKRVRAACPGIRIVMFSAFDNPTYVAQAISAGAHDYVLKSASRQEIIAAVAGAAAGTAPPRQGDFRRTAGAMSDKTLPKGVDVPLTPRETQVLRLVAMGLSNQEIADALEISIETVKEHVQNLLRKLALGDRTQAAVWAIRHGIG